MPSAGDEAQDRTETRFCASVSASHQTSNLIDQTCRNGPVQLSLRPHFDHPGLGNDAALAGVGEMLQARSRCRLYWVHAVWVVNLFLYLVVAWWIFYRWRTQQPWTFFLFIFVLISPTILLPGLCRSFPPESSLDEFVNYKTHYYSNHRLFFVLFALYSPVDFADTLLKGHFASSRIGAALLHQQHPLFRLSSDRRDYAE